MSSSGQPTSTLSPAEPGSGRAGQAKPALYIISGPSGSGKSTITARLAAAGKAVFSVSYTTRKCHHSEREGIDYRFVSEPRFKQLQSNGELLESALVHGNWYGTSRADINDFLAKGKNVMLEIDVKGAEQVRTCGLPCTSIFILPPSPEELLARLAGRQREEDEQIRMRLANARQEVQAIADFEFFIINRDIDQAVQDIAGIIDNRDRSHNLANQQELIEKWQQWARK